MGDLDLNPSEMFAAAGTTHIERQWFALRCVASYVCVCG
jgi:hypothetical protein